MDRSNEIIMSLIRRNLLVYLKISKKYYWIEKEIRVKVRVRAIDSLKGCILYDWRIYILVEIFCVLSNIIFVLYLINYEN